MAQQQQVDLNTARVIFLKQQREQADLLDQLCDMVNKLAKEIEELKKPKTEEPKKD